MNLKKILFSVIVLALLLSSANPISAAEDGTLEEGYEFVWNSQTDIILYFPNNAYGNLYSADGQVDQSKLIKLEQEFSRNAWRDVDVFIAEDGPREGLLGVQLIITWTTSSKAISFVDWRAMQEARNIQSNKLSLSAATGNSTGTVIADVLPDEVAVEGDVSRAAVDTGGTQSQQLKNTTDIDTTSSVIVDFTDYNHSKADWLDVSSLRMSGGANLSITVNYADAAGRIWDNVTVFTSDQYLAAEDLLIQLPAPTNATNTYVANLNFTALELDEWRLFDFASEDYDLEGSNYVFNQTIPTSAVGLSGIGKSFKSFMGKTADKMRDFSVKKTSKKVSQRGVGFANIKNSALYAAAAATKTKAANVVDHEIVRAQDYVRLPVKLSQTVYNNMQAKFDAGEENAQAAVREARKSLKSVQVTVGVKAAAFGKKVDHARDMTKEAIVGIGKSGGNAVSSATGWGKGIFDSAKDSVGRLKDEGAGLFSKLGSGLFNAKNRMRNIIIIAVIIVAAIAAIYIMKNRM